MWDSNMPSPGELKDLIIDAEKIKGEGAWLLWCEDYGYDPDPDQSYDHLLEYINDREQSSRAHYDESRCDEMRGT